MEDARTSPARAAETILRYEERLALTQQTLRTFSDELNAAIGALDERSRETLVVTTDVSAPGTPTHAVSVVLHIYGFTATVEADGVERVSAASSLPALAETFAKIDGAIVRGGAVSLVGDARTFTAADFLDASIAAVATAIDDRSAAYNPALVVTA